MPNKVVTLGEVLMRLSTPSHKRFSQTDQFTLDFGGAEANVAVSLAQWGIATTHVTALPENDLGKAAISFLREHNVNTDQIYFAPGRMGLYFFENGTMQRSSRIIYDRFDSVFSDFSGDEIDWGQVFDGADCFHWTGITPALSANAAKLTLTALQAASQKGLLISGDINYRRNLWNYGKNPLDIMPELISYTNVIVAGITDLNNCLGIEEESDYEKACAHALSNNSSIKLITSTERNSISASHNQLKGMLYDGRNMHISKSYDITHIVDRIGGGDAYIAGLLYGLLNFTKIEALEFATAASVLKHSISGDVNLASLEEVEALVRGENVGKLLR
ncbi:sugar kinase [Litoribacter alkaliphilus]|uniref:Sugar kinase n=1 Tax=Litoribacter ruber TaxID=702568 RepID=A0AAP2G0G7_9BACT|nr:sugar kinase [Litoribacter alkaliphilus]MBS9522784.1 sugar kinase [Litoribacter alkaliphilus]